MSSLEIDIFDLKIMVKSGLELKLHNLYCHTEEGDENI